MQKQKNNCIDDDHIILIMADDIAHNERNPLQGVIRRELDGENLYEDVHIDYQLGDLTLNDLKQINTLVKNKVDLSNTRNIVIASLILTTGIGGAEMTIGSITIGGIGLAAMVGVILNLVIPNNIK